MFNASLIHSRLQSYLSLMRLDKPIGIFLLLWPTLWALWLSMMGFPQWHLLFIFITGVVVMRSAGCIINDWADRNIDLHVNRTRNRPITSGKIKAKNALILFIILCGLAFLLVLSTNFITITLAFVALGLAILYPFMKRFFNAPQLILGITFAWGIPMAFAATTQHFPIICWLLFMANLCWIIAYDTEYAMVDQKDDLKIGVKSTAILLGKYTKLVIGLLQFLFILILILVGIIAQLHWVYYAGICVASLFFFYQQYLIFSKNEVNYFKAFINNHWVGAVIFVGILLNFFHI